MFNSNNNLRINFGDGNVIDITNFFDGSGSFTGSEYGIGRIENILLEI